MDGQTSCADATWKQDYKQTITNIEENNEINIKITDLQTWVAKKQDGGTIESSTGEETTETTEDLKNKPEEEKKDKSTTFSSVDDVDKDEIKEKIKEKINELDTATQTEVINGFTAKYEQLKNELINNATLNNTTGDTTNTTVDTTIYDTAYNNAVNAYQNYTPKTVVDNLEIDYYKKMENHKMKTNIKIQTTICTATDMTIIENVDGFVQLIKNNGVLQKYLVKGYEM